jgi:hypothetical protein
LCVLVASSLQGRAEPIFTQIRDPSSKSDGASGSDRAAFSNFGAQVADDLTLASPATARSVTWWGIIGLFNFTPVTPVAFDLILYRDLNGAPNLNDVISSTTVTFDTLTDTGEVLNRSKVYLFKANLSPTSLPGGTRVWFSILADTSNDPDDSFLWRHSNNAGTVAERLTNQGAFAIYTGEPGFEMSFILDDAPLPGPVFKITSFDSLGSGVFELTLKGEAGTSYEFRSAPTLDFTQGTQVSNLLKGNSGDPGMISGFNGSVVTTDGNGDAIVQMVLTGPANFVRAQKTE